MFKNKQHLNIMTARNNSIEPPWAGFERSLSNFLLWAFLSLVLIPGILGGILYVLWRIGSGYDPYIPIMYSLGLLFGGLPFLIAMEESKKLHLKVKSQEVTIVTNDLPASKEREASDSREETPLHGYKLGEGDHILGPFDQIYATLPIEIEYQVNITEPFRVKIGINNKVKDLMVKGVTADFKTDSEHLLALARISKDDTERKNKIEARMKNIIKRFIGEECRKIAKAGVDPADESDGVSENVEGRLETLLQTDYPGFELKSFTLGDIDDPDAVEEARDKAAMVAEMTIAAENLLLLNKAEGAPDRGKMTPTEATDIALTAAGIKTATKAEKTLKVDSGTLEITGKILETLMEIFKR